MMPPTLGSQIRDLAADGGGTITQILRPQPVFADGHQRGYRVYPGPDRAQFAKLGLMPGDLVTAVNGTPSTTRRAASRSSRPWTRRRT